MARSLLIALLSVVAVAGPASAQLPALPADPIATVDVAVDSVTCELTLCVAEAGDGCQYVYYDINTRTWPPEFDVVVDPKYCLRGLIDELVPPTLDWISWTSPAAAEASDDSESPSDETAPA